MGEIKQTNFRIDTESADAFRAYCEANGLNQAQGFDALITAMELNEARAAIPERETEIANFQAKANELVEAFLHSLQLNQDAEARIRAEFQRQLDLKDKTIENYQEQIKVEQEKAAALTETQMQLMQMQVEAAEIRAKLTAKEEEIALLNETHVRQLADKDSINTMLTEKLAAAEANAAGYADLKKAHDALIDDLKAAKADFAEYQRRQEVAVERAAMAAEKALRDAVREAEKEADKAVKAAQGDYIAAQKELRHMEAEKADLREKLAKLEAENAALVAVKEKNEEVVESGE